MAADALFQPFSLGSLHLANRIVMAPMTRQMSPQGVPGEDVAKYYQRRAANHVGLIITEGTTIDRPAASMNINIPNFYSPEALAGWKKTVDAVHAVGGKIAPQLWHVGQARPDHNIPNPDIVSESPFGLTHEGIARGQAMSEEDIADTISAFGKAAKAAVEIGFDAVEIHGAHGYLIDQFFWDQMNKRTDRYGGDLTGRTRFGQEVIKAVRENVPADFPVIFRFSLWKQQDYKASLAQTPDELARFLAPLSEAGVDIFHASSRRFWEPSFEGSSLNLAGWTKKLTGKPAITVGSVGLNSDFFGAFRGEVSEKSDLSTLIERLDADEFDLVGVGRALLSDPQWATKIYEAREDELQDYNPEALKVLT
ncbi:NADH:flavin oxidoreductase [Woodsholea maritima]|uniref:NADH:flavin oxidoreductase n=1 Tax=Woodsholea maritima TaxID=240237 RepID=UPI00035EE292|nr:NADH:flavin oxidoreductase [Woodsholea maritima]